MRLKGRTFAQPRSTAAAPAALGSDAWPTRGFTAPPSSKSASVSRGRTSEPCCRLPHRTLPVLQRSATEGPPRWPRRSGQGILLRAAGIPGSHGLGALGRTAGTRLQSSLGADRHARAAASRDASARIGEHLHPDKISGLERGAGYLLKQGRVGSVRRRTSGPRRCSPRGASKAHACCKGC